MFSSKGLVEPVVEPEPENEEGDDDEDIVVEPAKNEEGDDEEDEPVVVPDKTLVVVIDGHKITYGYWDSVLCGVDFEEGRLKKRLKTTTKALEAARREIRLLKTGRRSKRS